MTDARENSPRLTARGQATRRRIVDTAAELFYEQGIVATSNNDIRTAARVSGSQLNHFFPSREVLVAAVLDQRVTDAVEPSRFPGAGMPHSLASLRAWADIYIERHEKLTGGCRVGSLASESMKSDLNLRDQISQGFEHWRQVLRDGFLTMKDTGELDAYADADYLSLVLLAALQGGLLLTQASGSTAALRAALDGAIQVVRGYAADRAPGEMA